MDALKIKQDIEKQKAKEDNEKMQERAPKFFAGLKRLQVELGVVMEPSLSVSAKGIVPTLSMALMDEDVQRQEREALLKEETGIEIAQ